MKIHLFGAAGAGVITLGQALSTQLGLPYFDTDTYFWLGTEEPDAQLGQNVAFLRAGY